MGNWSIIRLSRWFLGIASPLVSRRIFSDAGIDSAEPSRYISRFHRRGYVEDISSVGPPPRVARGRRRQPFSRRDSSALSASVHWRTDVFGCRWADPVECDRGRAVGLIPGGPRLIFDNLEVLQEWQSLLNVPPADVRKRGGRKAYSAKTLFLSLD